MPTICHMFRLIVLLAPAIVLGGCATNPVTGKSDFVLMSEEQEIALGAQSHKEILKQYKVYEDPGLQAYVETLGQTLAAQSHRSNLDYRFTLLDSPQVNAFALPGGYIYVTRDILAFMNNEEELAGVLGHELGHVTARHGVRQQSAQTAAGLLGILAAVATGSGEVAQLSNQLGGALVSGYGRSHELEADRLGAEYLARADYDPEMMLEVIGILKNQEEFEIQRAKEEGRQPRIYHGVFSTHPRNDQRLQEVVRAAEVYANPDPLKPDPDQFLRLMDGMTYGDSEDQGIVRGNRFYHKALDVTLAFPAGWRIENQPHQLVAVRSDGTAGMIVRLDQLQASEGAEQYLRRTFPSLQNGRELGANGFTGIATGETPFGNQPFSVSSVADGDRVFLVAGFAQGSRPDQAFLDTASSIRHLEPGEDKLATAKRIRLVRAQSGDTFANLAESSDLGEYAEEELRLLNDMYPEGEPIPGQLLKLIN